MGKQLLICIFLLTGFLLTVEGKGLYGRTAPKRSGRYFLRKTRSIPAGAGFVVQGPKLTDTSIPGTDFQGWSTSISADGNTAIVGGYGNNGNIGAGWIYTRSNGVWTQQVKLVGTGATTSSSLQGQSVAISSDGLTAVIGGPKDNGGVGSIWVFTSSGGVWSQQSRLSASDAIGTSAQGWSVSLSADGNTLLEGGYSDNINMGASWVFTRNAGVWTQQGSKLVGTGSVGPRVLQGSSVSLSADGNTALVGGYGDNSSGVGNNISIGAAWLFTRSGGVWTQRGSKATPSDESGNGRFGYSVSLSANATTAIIGADLDGGQIGAAWIYTASGSGLTQAGSKLVGTGIGTSSPAISLQGAAVSISADGSTVAVGGWGDQNYAGAIWVYSNSTGSWAQNGSKLVFAGSSNLGKALSLSSDGMTIFSGEPNDISGSTYYGASVAFAVPYATPAVQATNLVFTNTTATSLTDTWTNGNGTSRLVFIYQGSLPNPVTPLPINLTTYTASTVYGSGTQIGSTGWFCVYNGSGSTVDVTGLTQGTPYKFMTLEYNGMTANQLYMTSTASGNPATVMTLAPAITVTGTLPPLTSTYGSVSSTDYITVSGNTLSSGITATAPAGYEISTSPGSGFVNSLTIGAAGAILSTRVYIRLTALPNASATPYTGTISLTSPGAPKAWSPVISGTVNPFLYDLYLNPVVKTYGMGLGSGNKAVSYSALANGESITGLTQTMDAAAISPLTATGTNFSILSSAATGGGTFLISNYSIIYHPYTGTVVPAPLTVTGNASHSYGTPLLTGPASAAFTSSPLQNGETIGTVTLNLGPGNSTTDGVSTYINSASVSSATGGTFSPSNYTIVYQPGNLLVTPAPIIVTGNTAKVYGTVLAGGINSGAFSISTVPGMMNGETIGSVTIAYTAGAAGTDPVNTYISAATPSVATGGTFDANNYAITYLAGVVVVMRKPLKITALDYTKNFGTQLVNGPGFTGFTPVGLQNAETIGSVTMAFGTGAAANAAVNSYAAQEIPSAATGGTFSMTNYFPTYFPAAIIVARQILTVTVSPLQATKTYGQVFTSGPGQLLFTSTGLQNGDLIGTVTLAYGTGAAGTDAVGTYSNSIIPSLAAGGTFIAANYTLVYTKADLIVTPANLVLIAGAVSKVYGTSVTGTSGSTAFTYPAIQNSETIASATIAYAAGSSATDAASPYTGSVTVSAPTGGTYAAGNYIISYAPNKLTVTPALLTITVASVNKIYGTLLTGGAGSAAFSATSLVNGESLASVSIGYGSGAAANAAVNTYPASVTASLPVGGSTFLATNYAIAYIAGDIVITPAPLVLTAKNTSHVYGIPMSTGTVGTGAFTYSALQNGEVISAATLSFTAGNNFSDGVNTYINSAHVTAPAGASFTASNYSISYATGNLTVTQAPLTITANNVLKVYGISLTGGAGSTAFTFTGLAGADKIGSVSVNYVSGASSSSGVGNYAGSVIANAATGGTFIPANYSILYQAGNLTVSPAPLRIDIADIYKVYGTRLSSLTSSSFTPTGLQNGELIASVSLSYGTGAAATDPVNRYPGSILTNFATGTGFLATNYQITYTPAAIQVTPASLTIAATGPLKSYGNSLVLTTGTSDFSATTTVNSEVVSSVTLTPDSYGAASTTAAGITYTVRPSAATGIAGFLASNYTIQYIDLSASVSKAILTITATGPLKSYGQPLSGAGSTDQFVVSSMATGESIASIGYSVDPAGQSTGSAAGLTYTVTPVSALGAGGFSPANYTVSYVPFTGTVSQAPLTISAVPAKKEYGTFLSADAGSALFIPSGLMNGENIGSVSLNYLSGGIATAAVGAYPGDITLRAATGGNFTPANYTIRYLPAVLTVSQAPLVLSAVPLQKSYGTLLVNNPLSTVFTPQGLKNSETIGTVNWQGGAGASATSPVGIYTGSALINSATGGTFLASNYMITYMPAPITVSPASLSVLAGDLHKTYGNTVKDSTSSPGYTLSGMQNGETARTVSLTFGTGASATAGVGTYTGSVVASGLTGGSFQTANYTLYYYPGNMVVIPAPLVISPADVSKLYGINLTSSSGSASFSASGLQNSETASTVSLTYGEGAAASALPGTYTGSVQAGSLTGGTLNLANYVIRYNLARLIVGTNTPLLALGSQPDCSTSLGSFTIQNYNAAYTYAVNPSLSVTASGARFTAPAGTYTLISTAPQSFASPVSASLTINPQPPVPVLVITNPAEVEAPATVTILSPAVTAGSSPDLVFSYFTDNAAARPLINPGTISISGTYYIRASNSAGCLSPLKAVYVSINPLPILVIVNPAPVNDPSTVDITSPAVTAGSSPGLIYTYYTDAAGTLPVTDPGFMRIAGTYYIKGTNAGGNSVIKKVIVTIDYQIYIPNVFTPNGDGKNDRFEILGIVHFPGSSLMIFNRSGNEIYHSADYHNTWDGSGQVPGTYYYALTLNKNGINKIYKGWVMILH